QADLLGYLVGVDQILVLEDQDRQAAAFRQAPAVRADGATTTPTPGRPCPPATAAAKEPTPGTSDSAGTTPARSGRSRCRTPPAADSRVAVAGGTRHRRAPRQLQRLQAHAVDQLEVAPAATPTRRALSDRRRDARAAPATCLGSCSDRTGPDAEVHPA